MGWALRADKMARAVYWNVGQQPVDLGSLAGSYYGCSYAYAINFDGIIVGESCRDGGGTHPVYFADRTRGVRGTAAPADLGRVAREPGTPPRGVGAGDVFACVLARCLALGQAIDAAVGWARVYAAGHVCGERFPTRRRAAAWHAANAEAFTPVDTAPLPRVAA